MGMQGGIGGTHLTPITLSPQVAPQAQEGAERGRPHRAASHRSGDAAGLGGPCPPVKGVSRAGWHFYASCGQAMLCPRVPSPGLCQWCRIPSPRVLGYPAPGLLPSPRNGSTNPPPLFLELLAGHVQGRLHVLPAPPLRGHCLLPVTSSWDPSPRPQAGVPQQGALMPWGAVGKAWDGHPPTFIYCKGKLSIERYIFLSLFLKIYFSAYGLARLPRAGREGGHPLPVQWEARAGAHTWFMPPSSMGCWVATGSSPPLRFSLPHASVSPPASTGGMEIGDVPDVVAPTAQAGFLGGVLEGDPCCAKPMSCPTVTAPCATHRAVHAPMGAHTATGHIPLESVFLTMSPCHGAVPKASPCPHPHPGHCPCRYPAL